VNLRERSQQFVLVAEVDKKVVASSDFQLQGGADEEDGLIGIVVRNAAEIWGLGLRL
jgi:hypothetical protein